MRVVERENKNIEPSTDEDGREREVTVKKQHRQYKQPEVLGEGGWMGEGGDEEEGGGLWVVWEGEGEEEEGGKRERSRAYRRN